MTRSGLSNISVSSGAKEEYSPDYDECATLEIHESHDMVSEGHGKQVCRVCGIRSYWPGAEEKCRGSEYRRSKYTSEFAREVLREELEEFFRWWESLEDEENTLPSINEWAANFFEWRK